MNNLAFYFGEPVNFKDICYIYPPKVRDVALNHEYYLYMKLLTFSQEEIEDEYTEHGLDLKDLLTPFEYLLNNAYNNLSFRDLLDRALFFFLHEQVTYLFEQKQILIGDIGGAKSIDNLRLLNEEDYFDFQNMIRDAVGIKAIQPPDPNEHPRIKAMKAKARYRDRVKAKKGLGLNLLSTISSICCMGYGLNPLNIGELSYAAIPILLATYQEKEKYDIDIRSLLAGADSKKVKPKYWIRNLDD